MSHFVKVLDGIVIDGIVAEQEFFNTFVDTSPGKWIQTSYNTRGNVHYGQNGQPDGGVALRGNYAGIGFIYDEKNDVFYPPRPKDANGLLCNSWSCTAETNWLWKPPIDMPQDDKFYKWDESLVSFVEYNPYDNQ